MHLAVETMSRSALASKIIAEGATEKLEDGAVATAVRGFAAIRLGGRRR